MARQNVTVENNLMRAIQAGQHFEQLLICAYGPLGHSVLIQQPEGQMTITRSGFHILSSILNENCSPHQKILWNCVEHFYRTFGDGVKSFVFVVNAILRGLPNHQGVHRIAQQLSSVQIGLSQLAVTSVDNSFKYNMLATFFNTRFSSSVASILSSLLYEWVSINLQPSIEIVLKDFPILCQYQHGTSRPVTDSCIRNGFIINRQPINLSKSGPVKLFFFPFDDIEAGHYRFDSLDVKCEINNFLVKMSDNRDVLTKILVVTPIILSDLDVFHLCEENFAIIQGVPIDQFNYLSKAISFESDTVDIIYEKGKEYIFLSIPSINQLIICGPTKELCKEYAVACCDALRLLHETDKPYLHNVILRGGGTWETRLHKHLSCNQALPSFGSRAELLAWHKTKQKVENDEILHKICSAFLDLEGDILDAVLQGIICVPRKLSEAQAHSKLNEDVIEPLALRIGILIHALGTVVTLIKIDDLIVTKKIT